MLSHLVTFVIGVFAGAVVWKLYGAVVASKAAAVEAKAQAVKDVLK